MSKIIILYGLPLTGKSTMCDYIHTKFDFTPIVIDNIWNSTFENPKYTFDESEIVFEKLIALVEKEVINCKTNIVIEGVFASIERLIKVKEISAKLNYNFFSILLFCNTDVLFKRNEERNKTLLRKLNNDVINFFKSKFNSNEFCDLAINTKNLSIETTKELIDKLVINGR